jgi:hypothetical protein
LWTPAVVEAYKAANPVPVVATADSLAEVPAAN